jgi:large subunit ribosomal protein L35
MSKTKLKVRNSAKKRFKVTGTGKIMRRRGFAGHLNTKKSRKKTRKAKKDVLVTGFYEKKLRKGMGIKKKKEKKDGQS